MSTTPHGTLRYELFLGLMALTLVALLGRLAWILYTGADKANRTAWRQRRMVITVPGRPGNIFARAWNRYVLLAGSKQAPYCYADPAMIPDDKLQEVANRAASALEMSPSQALGLLLARRDTSYVVLRRELSERQVKAVRDLDLRAVQVDYEWQRAYPAGELAATVLGYRRRDGEAGAGLELGLDRCLAAADGQRVLLADALRRPIWPVSEESRPPRDGMHVFLSIDSVIQGFLEDAVAQSVERFGAKWGTGIIVNPQTGQILAMCATPPFNPNAYGQYSQDCVTNKALAAPYEPGSAIKPVFAAAAVQAGVMNYQTTIFCENGMYHASRGGVISDHGSKYGTLSLCDVVVFSSNIGMAKVGEALGNDALYSAARQFGFGTPTGIDLPGETGGIVRPRAKWDGYSTRRVPFGQEISVSSLQLTMAFASMANGGLLLRPSVVDCIKDSAGNTIWRHKRQVVRRVLSPEVADQTLQVLREVVLRGTGKGCRMQQWSSFGKTGTAEIAVDGAYVDGAFVGSFVGGAPVRQPQVLCLISIYWPDKSKGHYGATVAAPYVKQVLERTLAYLDVPPDLPDERVLLAGTAAPGDGRLAAARRQD